MSDICIARKYLKKAENAKERGIEFRLTFTSYKNLIRAKKCYYTGIRLTAASEGGVLRPTDRTIDRINSKLGYVKGNVCACCHEANNFKAVLERHGLIGFPEAKKIIKAMEKGK